MPAVNGFVNVPRFTPSGYCVSERSVLPSVHDP